MSLANLSVFYGAMAVRTKMAEDQCRDFEELIAQWFLDNNEGAREFLREIGMDHRERQYSAGASNVVKLDWQGASSFGEFSMKQSVEKP